MLFNYRWMVIILVILAGLLLPACSSVQPLEAASEKPAIVEPIEGTELNRLILTEKAVQRLDIHTAPVRAELVEDSPREVIPYSALIYDLNGGTWIYVSPSPLTYVREPVTVDYIEGDMVVLAAGPAAGTEVVTVGVPELYGADTGIGK